MGMNNKNPKKLETFALLQIAAEALYVWGGSLRIDQKSYQF